jgi:hypothetical protein
MTTEIGEVWEEVPLYLVSFRPTRHFTDEQVAELTDEEVYGAEWAGDGHGNHWSRGHDAGSLRDVRPTPVLTWRLKPGDRLIRQFRIRFKRAVVRDDRGGEAPPVTYLGRVTEARWEDETFFDPRAAGDDAKRLVAVTTCDPHPRLLGDDSDPHAPTDAVRLMVETYPDDMRFMAVRLELRPPDPGGREEHSFTF